MVRANWKGVLRVGELTCPVALYTAVSTSDRIAFHTLNRKTGHRVRRQMVEPDSGEVVETPDQVKGYDMGDGEYIVLEPEEIAAAVPESDKTLRVETFLKCGDIDKVYFDKPYYLAPAGPAATEAFDVIREGLRSRKAAALARAVLFRRVRTVLIRVHDSGLIATTLNFDYEVRAAEDAFADVPAPDMPEEMIELARHIIKTKTGRFDPSSVTDRYEEAVADLVRAKAEGKPLPRRAPPKVTPPSDLMEALRQSAAVPRRPSARKAAAPARRPRAAPRPRKAS